MIESSQLRRRGDRRTWHSACTKTGPSQPSHGVRRECRAWFDNLDVGFFVVAQHTVKRNGGTIRPGDVEAGQDVETT